MKKVLFVLIAMFHTLLIGQGEGGVFTSQRLASLRTGEGSLGNNPAALNWFQDVRNKTAKLGAEKTLSLEDIKGTVYLDKNFKRGTIYYRYSPYGEYQLRYDAFNDEIELKRGAGTAIEALHKNEAISCRIEQEEFNYLSFKSLSNKVEKGYLIPLFEGDRYTLYIRKVKIFKEGKPAKTSLQNSFPPRFLDEQTYFVSVGNEIPFQIKISKKEVVKLVGANHKEALKGFLKRGGISLKDLDGLIQTFVYMDQL